ncbi:hypothetical protein F4802DRAFT_614545 [Xylaria palmicola]|nr:hypothetical protein F4802DRAFT_614545 [Xylaria palmicola]
MAPYAQHLQRLSQSFLKLDPSSLPEVLVIFLGGSRLYKQQAHLTLGGVFNQSDYDSIVVLPTKRDIYSMLTDKWRRKAFAEMVGIEREEFVHLEVPSPTSSLWSEFDAVGFTGYGASGDERSIKILNLLDICRKETTNLLTSKDRRVFEAVGPGGRRSLCVQTTTLPNRLKIQHEQWVYSTPSEVNNPRLAFGYMADLLLTSACVYDKDTYGDNIKKIIAKMYSSKMGPYPTVQSFCRSPYFHPTYIAWLRQELTALFAPSKAHTHFPSHNTGVEQSQVFLGETYGTRTMIGLEITSSSAKQVSDDTLRQFNDGKITQLQEQTSTFSSSSTSYAARTDDGVEIFVKEAPLAKDEKHEAKSAASFFPRVMIPRIATKGELLYPLFRGTTKSNVRLSYIRSGRKDRDLGQRLLHAEMVQAEDTLRAYRQSLSLTGSSIDNAGAPPRYNIQRYFHDRLVDDSWMHRHYGQVRLPGVEHPMPLNQLLAMRWSIDGNSYASLQDAFDYARSVIAPESPHLRVSPTVFGLGDGHNIMLSDAFRRKGGSSEVLFIDSEVSGVHPVMLDLARPLYVDTMFELLFRNTIGDGHDSETRCHVADGEIVVDLAHRVDVMAQAILRIKTQYLLKPLCAEVERLGGDLADHVPLLAVAMFLCATVSRNFSHDPIALVENFAVGLKFLKARSWEDIDTCFRELGFR